MAYINNLGQVRIGVRGWVAAQSGAGVTDADATLFITASGITDSTQISALNTLVNDLKTYGLWTKMKAIYPFVGGSAASHKFNLKDTRDADAAFRLMFSGGWLHTSTGAKPNGVNTYANTYIVPNDVFNNTDLVAAGYYSRTATTNVPRDYVLGSYTVGKGSISMVIRRTNDNFYTQANADFPSGSSYRQLELSPNPYTGDGLYHFSQQGTSFKYWRNTTLIGQNGAASLNLQQPTHPIFLGTYNSNGSPAGDWTDKELAFAYFSNKLTDIEASTLYNTIQKFQTTLGRHIGTPYVSDPDAIAFLTAAGITDGTQAAAINTLVIRMKADGVWTKMKAIYPFVGGSATSHKWNLKDPRDLDVAYRLVFNGGWTHTGTGAKPNGSNAYGDSKITPSAMGQDNIHISFYSRTDANNSGYDIGSGRIGNAVIISPRETNSLSFYMNHWVSDSVSNLSSLGFYTGRRLSSTSAAVFKNGSKIIDSTKTSISPTPTANFYLGAYNLSGMIINYSLREQAFASIGDGLTDTDCINLYSTVQAYQTTLGRQVDVPIVSDTDAQTFLNAANITSFQQANAVNKLVVDLKAAGVWSKMKAIYPFVGGNATSHKFNLKDPRDLDAAFRLVFNGGWTHTSTGALPNGTTGYADTKLNESSVMTLGSQHISFYSRTNVQGLYIDMGIWGNTPAPGYPAGYGSQLLLRYTWPSTTDSFIGYSTDGDNNYISNNDSRGFFMSNRTSNSQLKLQKNSTINTFTSNAINKTNLNFYIGARNIYNSTSYLYSPRESAFATIGDGLTDAEATALYTAVETYQTSLGRGVNTPIYNNGLVLNLDAGNANSYPGTGTTWFDLAAGNNGTLVNGPTYDSTNGGSISFDGVNDNVDLGTGLNSTSLTISLWLNFNSTSNQAILNKGNFNNNQASYTISYYNNKIRFDTYASDTVYGTLSSNFIPVLNTWYNIVYVANSNSSTYSIYINGINRTTDLLDFSSNYKIPRTGSYLVKLGSNSDGALPFRGKISKVLIYENVLSATEILNNFNSTRGRFGL